MTFSRLFSLKALQPKCLSCHLLNRYATIMADTSDPVVWQGRSDNFTSQGFVLVDRLIPEQFACELCQRLDDILDSQDGSGDVGKPDKVPPLGKNHQKAVPNGGHKPLTTLPSKRTLQVINIWKADSAFK